METEVTFFSENEEVRGTLCVPDDIEAQVPAVALLHGYGSFRDELTGFTELAALLSAHRIASLRFDFRGCGASGRSGRIHPHDEWIEDACCALTFLEDHPQVDAERLGLVGMSVGGGVTVQATALDERVGCAVALAPVADGRWWLEHLWKTAHGVDAWQQFLESLETDRRHRARYGTSRQVPIEEILAYGPKDMADREFMLAQYPQFAAVTQLSSADSLCQFQPRHLVHQIAPRPIRFVHSLADTSVPVTHSYELFGRARETRDLQLVSDSPHCFWIGPDNQYVQEMTLEWLTRFL